VAIVVVGRVTKVVAKLEVWRRAADVVRDAAGASQSLARVAVARSVTQRLPPLPERVEDDGRHVDLHPAEQAEAEAPRLSSCPKAGSRDTPAEAVGSDEQERFRMRVHALTTQPPPAPWTLHEPIGVGGLTGVGFGEVTGPRLPSRRKPRWAHGVRP
jgi:hypothetical protein